MSKYQIIQKILLLPQIGNKTALKIINNLNINNYSDKELYEFILDLQLPRFKKLDSERYLKWQENCDNIFNNNELNNIKNIIYSDDRYPKELKELKNFPLILNYKGNIESLNSMAGVSVIGTREPTQYGEKIGFRIGEILAERNIGVISGLAVGCDFFGHSGAISKKGFTCAVLAHGLQEIYPKQNLALAEKILEEDGLLITEYPYGTSPTKNTFVDRDRIQAGLANSTIVIETGIKGGTMHAVNTTLELQRNLYCVTHPDKYKKEEKIQGNIQLIKEGKAKPLGNKEELEELVNLVKQGRSNLNEPFSLF
ncbi:DNA-processing protein DprA [Acinetobacter indicus]|uniref:DNA-processing protein DprA n=1 Tax=Acinetobacter indicus TaxID=756892 RepID=UPI000CEBDFAF|nr:DNA-processing protein DprA [Acinetobacter indicus]